MPYAVACLKPARPPAAYAHAAQLHLHHGTAPAAGGGGGAKAKDLTKKAVLLSGPPGIGKTSAAHIIAR